MSVKIRKEIRAEDSSGDAVIATIGEHGGEKTIDVYLSGSSAYLTPDDAIDFAEALIELAQEALAP